MASPTRTLLDTNIQLGQNSYALIASQNDWNPSFNGTIDKFGLVGVVTVNPSLHVTGIQSGIAGRMLIIVSQNGSGGTFTLDNESGSSSAANRMRLGGANVNIGFGAVNPGIFLMYDEDDLRWYNMS